MTYTHLKLGFPSSNIETIDKLIVIEPITAISMKAVNNHFPPKKLSSTLLLAKIYEAVINPNKLAVIVAMVEKNDIV